MRQSADIGKLVQLLDDCDWYQSEDLYADDTCMHISVPSGFSCGRIGLVLDTSRTFKDLGGRGALQVLVSGNVGWISKFYVEILI